MASIIGHENNTSAESAEHDRIVSVMKNSVEHDRIEGQYNASLRSKVLLIIFMAVLSAIAFICSLAIGSVDIPFGDTLAVLGHHIFPSWISLPDNSWYDTIILNERLPRTLLCLLTGISLAAAGTVMQGLLRTCL